MSIFDSLFGTKKVAVVNIRPDLIENGDVGDAFKIFVENVSPADTEKTVYNIGRNQSGKLQYAGKSEGITGGVKLTADILRAAGCDPDAIAEFERVRK